MKPDARRELSAALGERVRFDEPLSRHTSLRVGGPADAFVSARTRDDLAAACRSAAQHGLELHVLGGGFNTLARDGGLRGLVLRLAGLKAIEADASGVRAEAGASHASVTRSAAERGLAGLEFAVGIPGSVGGWVAMNAGIGPGREMRDVLAELEWYDPARERFERCEASALRFHYRHTELPRGAVVCAARFALTPDDPARVRARGQDYLAARRETQPVDERSCGSVFKNPPGDHAGRLIEAAGLKGSSQGGASISERHANFIVNRGDACAADVLALIERARATVAERFDVQLETEVRVIGEQP